MSAPMRYCFAILSCAAFSMIVAIPAGAQETAPADTIWAGREFDTRFLAPRADTIDGYRIRDGQRTKTFTMFEQIETAPASSGGAFLLRSIVGGGSNEGTTIYTTVVKDRTLAPVHTTERFLRLHIQ